MRNITLATLILALGVGPACAGESGTINQAGPYEATMQFYLHPAHGFTDGSDPTQQPTFVADNHEAKVKGPARWIANAHHWFAARALHSAGSHASSRQTS